MSEALQAVPFVRSIFHPSDFSKASELAFAHALAVALVRKTKLVIMHAGRGFLDDWAQFPPVRKTLENWNVLAPGSPRSAVSAKLSVRVAMATEGRQGFLDAIRGSVTEQVVCGAPCPVLAVPAR
jgi:nucleotide-binding universal stress UspA family protein